MKRFWTSLCVALALLGIGPLAFGMTPGQFVFLVGAQAYNFTAAKLAHAYNSMTTPPWSLLRTVVATQNSIPTVMASPPTITIGAANAGPVFYPNATLYDITTATSQVALLAPSLWALTYSPNGNSFYLPPPTLGDSGDFGEIAFDFDGTNLGFKMDGNTSMVLYVDGQLAQSGIISYGSNTTAGIPWVISVVFPSRARRHIIAVPQFGYGISGVWVGSNDTIEASYFNTSPTIAFMTDSYGYQPGSTLPAGFAGDVWNRLGGGNINEVNFYLSAGGGSGYITGGIPNKTFQQREPSLVAVNPDIIVTAGGINDSATGLQVGAQAYFAANRAALPNHLAVVTGNWNPNGTSTGSATTKWTDIIAGLQAGDPSGPYVIINNIAGTWQTSWGTSGVIGNGPWQTGDGRSDTLTAALVAATSATFTATWAGTTGTYFVTFSDGSVYKSTLTNGNATFSWSAGVTAGNSANNLNNFGAGIGFTGALSNATSATLSSAWAGTTGQYYLRFSTGEVRVVTLTSGLTTATWAGTVTASASVGAYTATPGNSIYYVDPDGTHPPLAGNVYLGSLVYDGLVAAIKSY